MDTFLRDCTLIIILKLFKAVYNYLWNNWTKYIVFILINVMFCLLISGKKTGGLLNWWIELDSTIIMTGKKKEGEQSAETYLQFFLQNKFNCSVSQWTIQMLRLSMNYSNFTFLKEGDYYSGQSKLWIHHSTMQYLPCWYDAVIFLHIII